MESEWDGSTVNFEPLSLKLEINIDTGLFPDDPCSLISVTTFLHTGPG